MWRFLSPWEMCCRGLRLRQGSCCCAQLPARPDTCSGSPGAVLWQHHPQCLPFDAFSRIKMEKKTPQSVWSNLNYKSFQGSDRLPGSPCSLQFLGFVCCVALIFIFLHSQRDTLTRDRCWLTTDLIFTRLVAVLSSSAAPLYIE